MLKLKEVARYISFRDLWAFCLTIGVPLAGLLLLAWEPNLVLMFILAEVFVFLVISTLRALALVIGVSERRRFITRFFEGLLHAGVQFLVVGLVSFFALTICVVLGNEFARWAVEHSKVFLGSDETTLLSMVIWPWIAAWELREAAPGVFPSIIVLTVYPFLELLWELIRYFLDPDPDIVATGDEAVLRFINMWIYTLLGCIFVLPFLSAQGEFFMRLLPYYSGHTLLISGFLLIKAVTYLYAQISVRQRHGIPTP